MDSEAQETNKSAMLDKDKIIIVVYLNTEYINPWDVNEFCCEMYRSLGGIFDDSVLKLVVPVREGETRVECINPKLLTEEQYKEVEQKVKDLTEKVENALKTLKKDE